MMWTAAKQRVVQVEAVDAASLLFFNTLKGEPFEKKERGVEKKKRPFSKSKVDFSKKATF